MDENKVKAIDKIYRLTLQDAEFSEELRKKLGIVSSANAVIVDDERISQIYEYCIEKIIRKQAEEFYNDFPLKTCKDSLIEDFVRMESFKRKDNFGDFCLSLYQQIECMTNKLCENKKLSDIVEKMWGYPAYVKTEIGKEISIEKRAESTFTIASLVFPGQNKKTGFSYAYEKSHGALQGQYAMDKVRTIVYFMGYKATMKNSDYDAYIEFTSLLSDIYQCRNMNHRGNTQTEWEKETQQKILPLKSFYYFKFIGVLAQYVEFIKSGFNNLDDMDKYCKSIEPKKIDAGGLKVVGKIDLPPDGKKRFK